MIIEEKFRGPPFSGNGGYVSGVFAGLLNHGVTEVTLRAPIPLDHEMSTVVTETEAKVWDGETLIAEVAAADLDLEIPDCPNWQAVIDAASGSYSFVESMHEASAAAKPAFAGRGFHPICFCCGADHEDGLGVFAAPVATATPGHVATIWPTRQNWAAEDGHLPAAYVWTAMDCPGQFAFLSNGIRTGLLGRMTAEILARPKAGMELMVSAWPIRVDGKKHYAGSAIHDRQGNLYGRAVTLWIGRRDG